MSNFCLYAYLVYFLVRVFLLFDSSVTSLFLFCAAVAVDFSDDRFDSAAFFLPSTSLSPLPASSCFPFLPPFAVVGAFRSFCPFKGLWPLQSLIYERDEVGDTNSLAK